ncbi:MAG: aminotransferase class V-fold PLP-dependent enzyme [Candidatus Porifericomitaceae bacterium WSBS_2022_MAG_OTU9]
MDISNEFTSDNGFIYLNHAAVSPWPKSACEAVKRFADDNWLHGAKNYSQWLACEERLRQRLAKLINAESARDIALLKSTSEALSFVASGLKFKHGDEIVIAAEEFPSNRIPWEALAMRGKVHLRQVKLGGSSTPERDLMDACGRKTRLISVSAVQYISGLRLQLTDLGEFCRKNGILLCVDAIQQLGAVAMDVQQQYLDFVVADGHKWMMGPEGLALFYCRPELREQLSISEYGWHMVKHLGDYGRRDWEPAEDARRFECGSPNLMAAHALDASLGLIQSYGMDNVSENIFINTKYLIENAKDMGLDIITPEKRHSHAGIVSFRLQEAEKIQQELNGYGIFCSCRDGALRISPHFYQNPNILDKFLSRLKYLLQK